MENIGHVDQINK